MADENAAAVPLLSSPAKAAAGGEPRRNMFAFACATLASMTTILMGYNLALMSGAQLFIREDLGLSDAQVEVLAGSINVFMLASILAAGWAADVLGRRGTLVLANVFLTAGALAMSLGASFPALMAARCVTSVGSGFSVVVSSSPRWLAMRGRHAEARAVLLRTSDTPAEADLRLQDIIKQATVAKEDDGDAAGNVWKELLVSPSASVRRIVVCVVGIHFFQQASGIDAIVLYSPLVFKAAGISSNTSVLAATVGVGVVKMCFVLVATLFSDRIGRRPLLLASTAGVAASMASLGAALCFAGAASTAAVVTSVVAFMAAFSVGLGPVVGTYSAEVMPLRLRAQGASLGMAVNRLTCGVVSMTFISLADAITMPGCFFLYAGVAAAACVFVYVRLPETRGRSLEDMDVLFAK
nr:unnamed protein product [Digitaria exilis]